MKRASRGASPARSRRAWLGPGTILALLIGGAALVMRYPGANAPAGAKLTKQLDSAGFASASAIPSPTQPLWKPEAGLLLERGQDLRLTDRQRTRIEQIDRQWRADKAALETSMRDMSSGTSSVLERTDATHGASLHAIQSGLGDYSRMSREYDARRASCWYQALALLSNAQRAAVDSWQTAAPQGRSAR
jgi:hypothetical protein